MFKLAYFDQNQETSNYFYESLKKDFQLIGEVQPRLYEKVLSQGPYDAIVISMELEGMDGLRLFEKIKTHSDYNGCPLIFVTDDESDNVTLFGLQFGADDVIYRGWSPDIKAERVRQKVFRYFKDYIYQLDNLRIDKKRYKVTINDQHVDLSLTEFKLLSCMVSRYPDPTGFTEIYKNVWGTEMDEKNLHTHLSNLRKKIKGWSLNLKTTFGKKIMIQES